jgi:hypothetical protein
LEIDGSAFSQDDWCVGGQDLIKIISSCVGLRKLVVCEVDSVQADLSPLLELPTVLPVPQSWGLCIHRRSPC